MTEIYFDTKGLEKSIKQLSKRMGDDFNKSLKKLVDRAGYDFLDMVQDMIIKKQVVDTRLLLNSFNKGGEGRIWTKSNGGLTLTVGTNLEYARAVNDGHWTVQQKRSGVLKDGTPYRWVPGVWNGSRFEYRKGAKTGMMLKRKWIDGTNYWDDAVKIFETMFPNQFRQHIQQLVKEMGI